MKNVLKRLFSKRGEVHAPLPHALDPDELMLLFPELGQYQNEILAEYEPGLTDVQEGEKVVGRIEHEFTRRLVIYHQYYIRREAEENVKAMHGPAAEREESKENHARFHQAKDALKELTFLAVMHELGLWDVERGLGLRRDWTVVRITERPMPDFMRGLFGQK